MEKGKLINNGVHLQPHEYHSVKILLENGSNIELVPISNIKGMKMPDMMVDGLYWEIKAPEGSTRNTIKHNFQNAAHQAENVIIDLYRCKLDQKTAIRELQHHFDLSKRIKRLKVITKDEEIIDIIKSKGLL